MPVAAFEHRVTNHRVHFLLDDDQLSDPFLTSVPVRTLLGLGAKFIPTPSFRTDEDVTRDVLYFCFRILSRFVKNTTSQSPDYDHLDFRHRQKPQRDITMLRRDLRSRCIRARLPYPISNWFKILESNALAAVRLARRLHGRRHYNLSPSLRFALAALQKRKDVNSDNADKNIGYMLYSTRRYLAEIASHLSDSAVYTPVFDTADHIIQSISDSAPFDAHSSVLPNRIRFKMKLHDKRLAKFYIIWKLHKSATNPPGRPIASAIGTVTANASRWLDSMLQPSLVDHEFVLRDSTQLTRILDSVDTTVTRTHTLTLATLDVTALYPSIDIGRGLDALRRFLPLTAIDPQLHNCILDIASWVLRNNYVSDPEGRFFLQRRGTAMGTPFAVVYATIFMIMLETPVVVAHSCDLLVYRRFIDDIFLIWLGTRASLIDFISELRRQDPLISFTFEISTSSIDFMDITVALDQHSRLSYKLYSKPLNNYLFVPAHSYHRSHTLSAFIRAEIYRRLEKCSFADDFIRLKHSFFHHLRARGYHTDMLLPIFDSVRWRDRSARLAATAARAARPPLPSPASLPFFFITTNTPEFELWRSQFLVDCRTISGLDDFDFLRDIYGSTTTVTGTRSAPALRRLLHH